MNRWLVLAALLFAPAPAGAADHLDSPRVKAAPEADITDVYAWMSGDKAKTYLVMNVSPMASAGSKFSDQIQYVFHLNSQEAYGEKDPSKIKHVNIICTFDFAQKVSCWLGPASMGGISAPTDFVNGDASATAGLVSQMGKMKVFAGLRDDPFFFNLDGFKAAAKQVETAAGAAGFGNIVDASGCPHLPADAAAAVAGQLSHAPGGGAAVDFFAHLNVLSIVLAVDTAEAAPGGKILGVWASTYRRP
jgi:Domain of unknown function (DUF4331)